MSRSDDPSVRARAESVYQSFVDAEPGTEDALLDSLLEELSSEERALALQMIDDYQDGDQPPGSTTDIEPLREGRILGDFQLEVELGRGGWGMVWQARQLSLGRKVALKILYPHHALSGRALRRFQREAAAAGRAVHTSIVSIHETGSCDGLHYICEDLVPGGTTLSDHLAEIRGRPSLPSDYYSRIATIFRELAEGLSAAHDAGVIHRDIKPSNILLTRGGQPLIADFGMAKLMSDASVSGDLTGTPYYMSPEQLTPRNVPVDGRTDVFGLGATLYEALTLRRAFDGDTWQQIAEKILSTEPPAPQLVKSRIPRDLAVICSKAIEKAPKDRYASMADMAEDLRRFLANEPIVARPPHLVARGRKWLARHPTQGVGIVAVALLSVALHRQIELQRSASDSANVAAAKAREAESLARDVFSLSADVDLDEIVVAADRLWPIRESAVPELEAWLDEARGQTAELGVHLGRLGGLRSRAQPWSAEEEDEHAREMERDRGLAEARAHLSRLREMESLLEARITEGDEGADDVAREIVPKLEQVREGIDLVSSFVPTMEERIRSGWDWRFDDSRDRWWHAQLSAFVARLIDFGDPEVGLIAGLSPDHGMGIERRLARARALDELTADGERARERWRRAVKEIADVERSPAYGGLRITPQRGLLPLGPDPRSGYWEFAHVVSGDVPDRDGATGELRITPTSCVVLVLLPGGRATLGGQSEASDEAYYDPYRLLASERTVHGVELEPFFISKYELSESQAELFGGGNAIMPRVAREAMGVYEREKLPVTRLSWDEFAVILGRMELGFPTEDEWEYAARGGTETPWWTGADRMSMAGKENLFDRAMVADWGAWRGEGEPLPDDHFEGPAPVDRFEPNPFGLHNVLGNVSEFCADQEDPDLVVVRGGAYKDGPEDARAGYRMYCPQDGAELHYGVRPVRRLEVPAEASPR